MNLVINQSACWFQNVYWFSQNKLTKFDQAVHVFYEKTIRKIMQKIIIKNSRLMIITQKWRQEEGRRRTPLCRTRACPSASNSQKLRSVMRLPAFLPVCACTGSYLRLWIYSKYFLNFSINTIFHLQFFEIVVKFCSKSKNWKTVLNPLHDALRIRGIGHNRLDLHLTCC